MFPPIFSLAPPRSPHGTTERGTLIWRLICGFARDCTVQATFSPTLDHRFTNPILVCTSPKKLPQDSRKWLDQVRLLDGYLDWVLMDRR